MGPDTSGACQCSHLRGAEREESSILVTRTDKEHAWLLKGVHSLDRLCGGNEVDKSIFRKGEGQRVVDIHRWKQKDH